MSALSCLTCRVPLEDESLIVIHAKGGHKLGHSTPDDYQSFLQTKTQLGGNYGFAPTFMPAMLFDFQQQLVEWAQKKGRAAIFADCGLGKTAIQLTWAENIVRHTNKRVLILTPLAVAEQTIREGQKFGIEAKHSRTGELFPITVANYERLHYFNPNDFVGCVCDESSILKSFDGSTRKAITAFMRKLPYRLLCTATAAPNDFTELGTSSEALGYLGHMDMLSRFFKSDQNTSKPVRRWTALKTGWASHSAGGGRGVWRFKRYAEEPFWKWVCSWARAVRKPSDLGCKDRGFILPALREEQHVVSSASLPPGQLFPIVAVGLREQREERRRTLKERCEKAAALVDGRPVILWAALNQEADTLERLIPDAVQVSGADSDEAKEEKFLAFVDGSVKVLVTKAVIGCWGLNFQHCAHQVTFPSHSFEQYYQAVRRSWRFGQTRDVTIDIVTTEGEREVLANLQRKQEAAERMFANLVGKMNEQMSIESTNFTQDEEVPSWL